MKELLIIIDGMDDEPNPLLGYKTPKDIAYMPGLEHMRNSGISSMISTIPDGFKPSTDTALLNILGCSMLCGNTGRSWFEVIGAGIDVKKDDLCIRCNLVRLNNNILDSHSADSLSEKEVSTLIDILNRYYSDEKIRFYKGKGFRAHLVIKDCKADVEAIPPHELLGKDISSLEIESSDCVLKSFLNKIIHDAPIIIEENGFKNIGIALWSADKMPNIRFNNLNGALISGVNLVKGIGKALNMRIIDVEGATGDSNTNYYGKFQAAINALKSEDFVLIHIEAPDEASHNRNPWKKIEILEKIDKFVLSPLFDLNFNLNIKIQSDHATSSITGQHLDIPVEKVEYNIIKYHES